MDDRRTDTGSAIRTCIGHQKPVTSCTLMPDGTTVISGGLDAVCRFFDAGSITANVPYSLANPMGVGSHWSGDIDFDLAEWAVRKWCGLF
jgi:WD40 repeat protein